MSSVVTAPLQSKACYPAIYRAENNVYINVQTLLLNTVRDCMGWEPGQIPIPGCSGPKVAQALAAKPQQEMGALQAFIASFQMMTGTPSS